MRLKFVLAGFLFVLTANAQQGNKRIPEAGEADYQKATIRIYHDASNSSKIILPVVR